MKMHSDDELERDLQQYSDLLPPRESKKPDTLKEYEKQLRRMEDPSVFAGPIVGYDDDPFWSPEEKQWTCGRGRAARTQYNTRRRGSVDNENLRKELRQFGYGTDITVNLARMTRSNSSVSSTINDNYQVERGKSQPALSEILKLSKAINTNLRHKHKLQRDNDTISLTSTGSWYTSADQVGDSSPNIVLSLLEFPELK